MWRLLLWLRKTSSYWSSQLEAAILKSSGLTGCARLQTYVLIQTPHQAFQDLTEHTIPAAIFFPKPEPSPVSLTGGEGWNNSRRGACPAEVQAWGVNRCVGSLPFRNGSRPRCTAAGCGANLSSPLPPPRAMCWNTESWRRWAGWGYGVNLIWRCPTFEEGG